MDGPEITVNRIQNTELVTLMTACGEMFIYEQKSVDSI